MSKKRETKTFRAPKCRSCGAEIEDQLSAYANYEDPEKSLCPVCRRVDTVKTAWQPVGSGSVVRAFYVADPPKNPFGPEGSLGEQDDYDISWSKRVASPKIP